MADEKERKVSGKWQIVYYKVRKTAGVVIIILLSLTDVRGQEHAAQWILGANVSVMDFRQPDTVLSYPITSSMFFSGTNANICDKDGNLLFFTNGVYIADRNGDTLSNGTGLNPSFYTTQYEYYGLPLIQAALFLPKPSNENEYYLFHYTYDILPSSRPSRIYYSLINASANFGLGEVIEKNVPMINGPIFSGCRMTACKHANGRDWWLVLHGWNNNRYYKFLITPDSIRGPFIQDIGPIFNNGGSDYRGQSVFSLDGSKFGTVTNESEIVLMDFDRCSGEFSNPITILNNVSLDPHQTISGGAGLAFSPSAKFLYVSGVVWLTQYDLLQPDPQHDSTQLFYFDSTVSSTSSNIETLYLGPNGKLYASTFHGGYYFMHVIHYPEFKGDSCMFQYGGQPTLSLNSNSLPNMINYRLGALAGGGCDTIVAINTEVHHGDLRSQMRIQPNPADKAFYIEMPSQGNYVFELVNQAGQVMERRETRQVDIINTENFSNGVYFLKSYEKGNTAICRVQKIVVQH